ncbi:peptidase family M49-domain-containing protein [Colletotrichum lupini]|nr:peptidase family M49-domain-containing protein [Colletotrichum lupini]
MTDSKVTHRLEARCVFDNLAKDEDEDGKAYKAYAHHLARACWYGSRIMLRQTSPEAEGILDFILELHKACNGQWDEFRTRGLDQEHLDCWLEYAATFLSSVGNYFESGDRKGIPNVPPDALRNMAMISPDAARKLEEIIGPMLNPQPASLGYPSDRSQSSYYPGKRITKVECQAISTLMEKHKLAPENTRLHKIEHGETDAENFDIYEILQASAETDPEPRLVDVIDIDERRAKIFLRRGDHVVEMTKICDELSQARLIASTQEQKTAISQLIDSFRTGNYESFRDAHKTWVKDRAPTVEHCMGFLFGYRDPYGARAEWQAAVGIADREETNKMSRLVARSTELIRTLPWAVPGVNDGKGPFEPSELDVPDFAIIHVIANVSSTVWEATNITIDDEDGKRHGVKNMVYGNRMQLNSSPGRPCYYVHPSEADAYMACAHTVRFVGTAIHELIGHGTGKLLSETAPGKYNFDYENPPVSPVTGQPVQTWYKPGESWNSVFGKLAPTVEECRAFLVSSYLADNKEILALFGYDEHSTLTADDFVYYSYLHFGVQGLSALSSFDAEDKVWGGDHDRAQFTILKHLLQDGGGVLRVEHDQEAGTLHVRVDRSKILSHGKPSIGRMLNKIHIWHSTADVKACRPFYESLSVVDGEYEVWRSIVASKPEPKWKFVQPNTFLSADGKVELVEYEATNRSRLCRSTVALCIYIGDMMLSIRGSSMYGYLYEKKSL